MDSIVSGPCLTVPALQQRVTVKPSLPGQRRNCYSRLFIERRFSFPCQAPPIIPTLAACDEAAVRLDEFIRSAARRGPHVVGDFTISPRRT